jgi:hypothetical protein
MDLARRRDALSQPSLPGLSKIMYEITYEQPELFNT